MATYSMTGFSRAQGEVGGSLLTVEIRSVNHRFLDLRLHLPRVLQALEQKTAELIRGYISRGRVEVWVEHQPGRAPVEVVWNRPLAKGILDAVKEMQEELGIPGDPDLSLLAAHKDVIISEERFSLDHGARTQYEHVLEVCLVELAKMRAREGALLLEDLLARAARTGTWVSRVSSHAKETVDAYRDRLAQRVAELSSGRELDQQRLAQESALFADRCDVTEEVVRFESHLEQFDKVLQGESPKGRKLDFLIQEMMREINTASNKAQHAGVSGLAVEVKAELEKMREQVQNLE